MKLSVIIPAYNEEKNLEKTILKSLAYLNKQDYSFEAIIVNDGSSDSTPELIKSFANKNNLVQYIDLQKNQGKGAAVKAGMLSAKGDYCLFMDADNATSADHLDEVWEKIKDGNDVVIASRHPRDVNNTNIEIAQSFWKQVFGKTGNCIIRFLTGLPYRDTQCGFKLFTKEAASKIFKDLKTVRWAFDVEVLLLAQKHNFKIGVIPVIWKNVDGSRVGLKGYFITLKELIQIKLSL